MPVLNNFSCNFSFEDSDISGEITVKENGDCVYLFDSPEDIANTVITVNNESVFVESDGYTKKFDIDSVPESSFTLCFYNAINSADVTNLIIDKDIVYICDNDSYSNYKIFFRHDGTVEKISLFNIETTIKLSNVIKT